MLILKKIHALLTTKEQRYAAISTLIITAVIITPLCGFLFQCGCDWPWAGLDSKCNFYKTHAQYRCPWCTSLFTGLSSSGAAVIAGIWVSMASLPLYVEQTIIKAIILRTTFGVQTFLLLASLSAGLAAMWQGYPLLGIINFVP